MHLVFARELGKCGQIFGRLLIMVKTLHEILQLQMVFRLELLPQVLGHEAVEICPHHFPADMHATAFVADEITQRHCLFRDFLTIVKTSIRTRSDDTGDAFLMA